MKQKKGLKMVSSAVDICNMALDFLNVKNITSLDDDTKEAKKCKMWYDLTRKSLLMNLNASFSIKRARLAEVEDKYPVYGFKLAYSLPNDCLQVLNINSPIENKNYQIEANNYLYTNDTSGGVYIRYIADIQNTALYDSEFCELFALKLAEKICMALTEDIEKMQYIKQLASQKYIEASTKYGRDNKPLVINVPKFRLARNNDEILDFNYRMY